MEFKCLESRYNYHYYFKFNDFSAIIKFEYKNELRRISPTKSNLGFQISKQEWPKEQPGIQKDTPVVLVDSWLIAWEFCTAAVVVDESCLIAVMSKNHLNHSKKHQRIPHKTRRRRNPGLIHIPSNFPQKDPRLQARNNRKTREEIP